MEGCCNDMKMVNSRTPQGGLGYTHVPNSSLGFTNVPSSGSGGIDVFDFASDLIPGGSIVNGIMDFATGLFKKDPDKVEYDRVRQQVWDSIVILCDTVDNQYKASNALTRSVLQQFIDAMDTLMKGFKAYTDKMLASGTDPNWINPRFHDYYDFGTRVLSAWRQEITLLPSDWGEWNPFESDYVPDLPFDLPGTPVTQNNFGQPSTGILPAGFDTTSMLLIGGVVVGLILMNRKRG